MGTNPLRARGIHRGFTLVELIVVIVILGVLSAVAIPKFFDFGARATSAAAAGSIGGIETALIAVHLDNRVRSAPTADWVTDIDDVAFAMQTYTLPEGVTIANGRLVDPEGTEYEFTAETVSDPAKLSIYSAPSSSPSIIAALVAGYLARKRRKAREADAGDDNRA